MWPALFLIVNGLSWLTAGESVSAPPQVLLHAIPAAEICSESRQLSADSPAAADHWEAADLAPQVARAERHFLPTIAGRAPLKREGASGEIRPGYKPPAVLLFPDISPRLQV